MGACAWALDRLICGIKLIAFAWLYWYNHRPGLSLGSIGLVAFRPPELRAHVLIIIFIELYTRAIKQILRKIIFLSLSRSQKLNLFVSRFKAKQLIHTRLKAENGSLLLWNLNWLTYRLLFRVPPLSDLLPALQGTAIWPIIHEYPGQRIQKDILNYQKGMHWSVWLHQKHQGMMRLTPRAQP